MHYLMFIVFVAILGIVLVGSCIYAHSPPKRYTAGWWAGIILASVVIIAAQSSFQVLPTKTVDTGCSKDTSVVWDQVAPQATEINWKIFCVGIFLGILAFEIIERVTIIPDKVIAFILLFLAFSSLLLLVYIFFIRKATYLIFSFVMGVFLSWFLHMAFISRLFGKEE